MLHINHLRANYPQAKGAPIISDLSLPSIDEGTVVGVLGPNAVGKSTLLKSLAGMLVATGDVRLNGRSLLSMMPSESGRYVSYLPQNLPQPVRLLGYESVLSACQASYPEYASGILEQRVEAIFQQLSITHLAMKMLEQMSGGQRQMIGLAQVLVRSPSLILLDEPTSALDIRWQIGVLQSLRQRVDMQGAIALIALHDINLALRHCDMLVVLSPQGKVAAGPVKQVLTADILYQAYGVVGRIEECSLGYPMVIVDHVEEEIWS